MATHANTTRRAFLKSVPACGVAAIAPAAAGPLATPIIALSAAERVDLAAKELAAALEGMHGGHWWIYANHDTGMVAVSRDFAREARGRPA